MLVHRSSLHQTQISYLDLEISPQDLLFPDPVSLILLRLDPFLLLREEGRDVLVQGHHSLIIQIFVTLIFSLLFFRMQKLHVTPWTSKTAPSPHLPGTALTLQGEENHGHFRANSQWGCSYLQTQNNNMGKENRCSDQ